METVKQKLHVYNSTFEIDNEDIIDLTLEYEFANYEATYFKNGKKYKQEIKPKIIFEINGKTKDGRECYLEFEVDMGLDELNGLKKEPVNIDKLISFDYPSIKRPNFDSDDGSFVFYTKTGSINDMYKNLASAYVYKKKKNVFIFKLSVPDEGIFIHFEVDFSKK